MEDKEKNKDDRSDEKGEKHNNKSEEKDLENKILEKDSKDKPFIGRTVLVTASKTFTKKPIAPIKKKSLEKVVTLEDEELEIEKKRKKEEKEEKKRLEEEEKKYQFYKRQEEKEERKNDLDSRNISGNFYDEIGRGQSSDFYSESNLGNNFYSEGNLDGSKQKGFREESHYSVPGNLGSGNISKDLYVVSSKEERREENPLFNGGSLYSARNKHDYLV